jgi:hypothetical protein
VNDDDLTLTSAAADVEAAAVLTLLSQSWSLLFPALLSCITLVNPSLPTLLTSFFSIPSCIYVVLNLLLFQFTRLLQ